MSTAAPLLEVEGLVKHFPIREPGLFGRRIGTVGALNGVDLRLESGETFAVVGESGCGKSTLAKTILGLHTPEAGHIALHGQEIDGRAARRPREMRQRLQMVFQDPYASLNPRLTAAESVCEPLVIHRIGTAAERRDRIADAARSVGIAPTDLGKYPHEFSGGERQRIAIARALVAEPELIVADEPLSSLDVSIQAQIVNLMTGLKARHGLTYLLISHDLSLVAYLADTVAVMYLGRIVEMGPSDSLFAAPQHPYTGLLIEAAPRLGAGHRRRAVARGEPASPIHPPSGCPFHPRCPKAREICENTRPELAQVATGPARHIAACHFPGAV